MGAVELRVREMATDGRPSGCERPWWGGFLSPAEPMSFYGLLRGELKRVHRTTANLPRVFTQALPLKRSVGNGSAPGKNPQDTRSRAEGDNRTEANNVRQHESRSSRRGIRGKLEGRV